MSSIFTDCLLCVTVCGMRQRGNVSEGAGRDFAKCELWYGLRIKNKG